MPKKSVQAAAARFDPAVTELLDGLAHPLRADLEALRSLVLAVDPAITEGVKWNSASYRLADWFATFHLRRPDQLLLVLHRGAKGKATGAPPPIADPHGFLQWRGADRAVVTLLAGQTTARASDLSALLRAWLANG